MIFIDSEKLSIEEKTGKTIVCYLCFPSVTIDIQGGIKEKVRSIFLLNSK
jgi:hypothetical protein